MVILQYKMKEWVQAMNKYKVLAIIGKSGAGKDFIMRQLFNLSNPLIEKKCRPAISSTTRPQRENETDGKEYHFISSVEVKLIGQTSFRGWEYGIDEKDLDIDKINVGVFDPVRVKNMAEDDRIELKVVEVCAPDKTRLMRQLQREKDPDIEEIIRRYYTDNADFETFLKDVEVTRIDNSSENWFAETALLNIITSWAN